MTRRTVLLAAVLAGCSPRTRGSTLVPVVVENVSIYEIQPFVDGRAGAPSLGVLRPGDWEPAWLLQGDLVGAVTSSTGTLDYFPDQAVPPGGGTVSFSRFR